MYIKTKKENKYIKGPFTSLTKGRVKQIYLADFENFINSRIFSHITERFSKINRL
jgi:hypothetical protein